MCEDEQADVLKQFRTRVAEGSLEGIRVAYRIAGGMPADERIDEVLVVSGENVATAQVFAGPRIGQEASTPLEQDQALTLLQQIGQTVDNLVPRSKARFVPDSVVGSVTLEVEGKRATYFFPVEEGKGLGRAAIPKLDATDVLGNLDQLLAQLLAKKGG